MITAFLISAGVLAAALIPKKKLSDKAKIMKVFVNREYGLKIGDEMRFPRLHKKHDKEIYTIYVYYLPLGLASESVESLLSAIEEALRKEVEYEFADGMLKLYVYHQKLPEKWTFTEDLIKPGTWEVAIGKNHKGIYYHDFDKYQTFLIGGVPGFGKTVLTKIMFASLIASNFQDVNIYVLDLKGGLEYSKYLGLPQVRGVASDIYEATELLIEVVEKMKAMEAIFKEKGYTNIVDTDIKERTFLFIDEGAELSPAMATGDKKKYAQACQAMVSEVARIGRAIGFRVIYSTQYPSSKSIDMSIKMNILAKVSFVVSNNVASRVILDEGGAEDLPSIPGRCIYLVDKPRIIQVPYIDDKLIFKMMEGRENEYTGKDRNDIIDDRQNGNGDNPPITNNL